MWETQTQRKYDTIINCNTILREIRLVEIETDQYQSVDKSRGSGIQTVVIKEVVVRMFASRLLHMITRRNEVTRKNIAATLRGMHVSPAKHSSASMTDGQTDRRTDGRRTKWSLCFAMLRRRHKNHIFSTSESKYLYYKVFLRNEMPVGRLHSRNSNAPCLLHIIWLVDELKNWQGIHKYPYEFSGDIVTSWRQRFSAINIGVFDVHNLDTRP